MSESEAHWSFGNDMLLHNMLQVHANVVTTTVSMSYCSYMKLSYDEISTRSMVFLPSCSVHDRLSTRAASKIFLLAERGFDPRTSGLWAQHAPLRHSAWWRNVVKRDPKLPKQSI